MFPILQAFLCNLFHYSMAVSSIRIIDSMWVIMAKMGQNGPYLAISQNLALSRKYEEKTHVTANFVEILDLCEIFL